MRHWRLWATVVVASVCGFAGGTAAAASSPDAFIFFGLNPDGSGNLFVGGSVPSTVAWSWQACRGPGLTTCAPFATGPSIDTGTAAPGTFFVASSSAGQIATSPVWLGNLVSTSPPRVSGVARANGLVLPVPGNWGGGWQSVFGDDSMQLAACARADGTECAALTAPGYIYACGGGDGAVIDPVFTGWYLRVADRHAENNGPAAPGAVTAGPIILPLASPYGAPVWRADPTTAVAVVGRIGAAVGPRVTSCGGPPLPATANPHHPKYQCGTSDPMQECRVATISRSGVALVWCGVLSCRPVVRLRRGQREAVLRQTSGAGSVQRASPGPITIRLPRAVRRRLGAGAAIESVSVGKALLARRRVTVSVAR